MENPHARPGPRPRVSSLKSSAASTRSFWGGAGKPPSPTLSATTTGSRLDFSHPPHLLITRADLRKSIGALTELTTQAKLLRQSLLALSQAQSAFGAALEACSRVKGCDTANAGMLGAGGLEFVLGVQEGVLADQVYRNFEIPLLETLDDYRASVTDRQMNYEKACLEKTTAIRKKEHENMRHGKRRKRDLQQFRTALAQLQSQVDELDYLKSTYHQEVMEAEDELWNTVANRVGFLVKAQLELYERVSSKSTDPSIEPLMALNPDPFDSYGPQPTQEGQIFSVLSPLGLLNNPPKAPTPSFPRTPSMAPGSALPTTTAASSANVSPNSKSPVAAPAAPSPAKAASSATVATAEGILGFATDIKGDGDETAEGSLARQLGEDVSAAPDTDKGVERAEEADGNGVNGTHSEVDADEEDGFLRGDRRGDLSTIDDASETDEVEVPAAEEDAEEVKTPAAGSKGEEGGEHHESPWADSHE